MRSHVFPIAEPSFRDNRNFGADYASLVTYLRKFSEHLVGTTAESGSYNYINASNKEASAVFFWETPSRVDGVAPFEIDIPPGFIVCIGSKGHLEPGYEGENPITLSGHPFDAFSRGVGVTYASINVLNRTTIGNSEWVTIMWVGTRWVWLGSNNWIS